MADGLLEDLSRKDEENTLSQTWLTNRPEIVTPWDPDGDKNEIHLAKIYKKKLSPKKIPAMYTYRKQKLSGISLLEAQNLHHSSRLLKQNSNIFILKDSLRALGEHQGDSNPSINVLLSEPIGTSSCSFICYLIFYMIKTLLGYFHKIALFTADVVCLSPRSTHGVNIRLKSHIFLVFIFSAFLWSLQDVSCKKRMMQWQSDILPRRPTCCPIPRWGSCLRPWWWCWQSCRVSSESGHPQTWSHSRSVASPGNMK